MGDTNSSRGSIACQFLIQRAGFPASTDFASARIEAAAVAVNALVDVRGRRAQQRLALSLFVCWLASIAGTYGVVSWWRPSAFWTALLFIYAIVGGYG